MSTLLVIIIAAYGLYALSTRPRSVDDGARWLIVDPGDSPLRVGLSAVVLLGATWYALTFGLIAVQKLAESPAYGLVLAVIVGIWGFLVWREGGRVREALVAAPGELRVSDWPLPAGGMVEFEYTRKIRTGKPKGKLTANLVFYEDYYDRDLSGNQVRKRQCAQLIPLKRRKLTFSDGLLTVRWKVEVPDDSKSPGEFFLHRFLSSISHRPRVPVGWVLEVHIPLQSGGTLDSKIPLRLEGQDGRLVA